MATKKTEAPANAEPVCTVKSDSQVAAEEYLQEQARILLKYGESPKLSGKRYANALKSITQTFETIESAR